jgi:hypothetical protein
MMRIEQRIAHPLPEDEVWFIYQYIISSGVVIEEHNDVSVIGHMHSSDEARLITIGLSPPSPIWSTATLTRMSRCTTGC